jgi:hypothetical protein
MTLRIFFKFQNKEMKKSLICHHLKAKDDFPSRRGRTDRINSKRGDLFPQKTPLISPLPPFEMRACRQLPSYKAETNCLAGFANVGF